MSSDDFDNELSINFDNSLSRMWIDSKDIDTNVIPYLNIFPFLFLINSDYILENKKRCTKNSKIKFELLLIKKKKKILIFFLINVIFLTYNYRDKKKWIVNGIDTFKVYQYLVPSKIKCHKCKRNFFKEIFLNHYFAYVGMKKSKNAEKENKSNSNYVESDKLNNSSQNVSNTLWFISLLISHY